MTSLARNGKAADYQSTTVPFEATFGMSSREFPLMEFDPSRDAVIDPARAITAFDVPDSFVLCFFQDAITRLVSELGGKEIGALESEMGTYDRAGPPDPPRS